MKTSHLLIGAAVLAAALAFRTARARPSDAKAPDNLKGAGRFSIFDANAMGYPTGYAPGWGPDAFGGVFGGGAGSGGFIYDPSAAGAIRYAAGWGL